MSTTIRMSEALAERAEQFAADTDRTLTELVEEAVDHFLRQPPPPEERIELPTISFGREMTAEEGRAFFREAEDSYDRFLEAKLLGQPFDPMSGEVEPCD